MLYLEKFLVFVIVLRSAIPSMSPIPTCSSADAVLVLAVAGVVGPGDRGHGLVVARAGEQLLGGGAQGGGGGGGQHLARCGHHLAGCSHHLARCPHGGKGVAEVAHVAEPARPRPRPRHAPTRHRTGVGPCWGRGWRSAGAGSSGYHRHRPEHVTESLN